MDWNVTKGQHLNNMIVFILWCSFLYAGIFCPSNALTHEDSLVNDARQSGKFKVGSTVSEKMKNGYEVTCSIEVENWTKYPLVGRKTHIVKGGLMSEMFQTIMPGWSEVGLTAHNSNHSKAGSFGTVSWYVQGKDRRLVVMWAVPYNHEFDKNQLGVGLSVGNNPHSYSWFHTMYEGDRTNTLVFRRKDFNHSSDPVIYRDKDFEIVGILDTEYKAKAKIIFFPRQFDDLEPEVRTTYAQLQSIISKGWHFIVAGGIWSIEFVEYYLLKIAEELARIISVLCGMYIVIVLPVKCFLTSPKQRSNENTREEEVKKDDKEEVVKKDDKEEECKICCSTSKLLQLIPCKHKYMCAACTFRIAKDKPECPFCRQTITGIRSRNMFWMVYHNGNHYRQWSPTFSSPRTGYSVVPNLFIAADRLQCNDVSLIRCS